MILDNFLMFTGSSNGATGGIVAGPNVDLPTTGTQFSSNVIDLHMAGLPVLAALQGARDMGIGDDPALKMLVQVVAAMTGGTSIQVALQGAPDNGAGLPGTFVNWWLSPAYAAAALVAGARLYDMDMPRPPAGVSIPRFLRMGFIGVGTFTAGGLLACIVLDRMDQYYSGVNNAILGGYPAGINIAN